MALIDRSHTTLPGTRVINPVASIGRWLATRVFAARRQRVHRQALRELLSMEDERLRDLGLRRADIHQALLRKR